MNLPDVIGAVRALLAPVVPTPVLRSLSMPQVWYDSRRGFGGATAAGTGALQSIAVRSSVDLICSLVSELPLHVYRGEGSDRQQLPLPGNILDPGDDGQGLEDWTYTLVESWLMRGNAYGDPVRDRLGYLRKLSLYSPDSVSVTLASGGGSQPEWAVSGKPAPDLVHLRVNPMAGVLLGFSPVEAHVVTILQSIAATQFGLQWFTEGTHPQSLLINTEAPIDPAQARIVLERWRAMKSGTREPAVLGKGWEFKPLTITPEESQFLGTLGVSEAQCCRIFGPAIAETLGYESGGSMTYSNVQDRRSDLLTLSLNRWVRRAERLLSMMLPTPQYARFDRDALLESTTVARYQAHELALRNRWKSINEVRDDEELAPVAWGDGQPAIQAAQPQPPQEVVE